MVCGIYEGGRETNLPWLVMGDFNEIRDESNREGQGVYNEEGPIGFNNMIEACSLNELYASQQGVVE